MKYLSILAAASLALSPAFSAAASSDNKKPVPGPVAGRSLNGAVPAAGVAVLGLLVVGGVIVALASGGGSSSNSTNKKQSSD